MLKIVKNEIHDILAYLFIDVVKPSIFPIDMKNADVTPLSEKNNSTEKERYRPISVLASASKLFERVLQKQIHAYMKTYNPHCYLGLERDKVPNMHFYV